MTAAIPERGEGSVIAGIDEAGLGPLVGPLTIGYAALRLPSPGTNPWHALRRAVTKEPDKDDRRLAVADSKKVFTRSPRGRKRLEATVLAFLSQLSPDGTPPEDGSELVFGPVSPPRERLAQHPWYEGLAPLPLHHERGSLELRAERLRRELVAQDVSLLQAGVRVVPAGELNDSYAETSNKSLSVWTKTLEVLRHLWSSHGHAGPFVTVDILGGRLRYGPLLARGFPDARVSWSREVTGHAAYRLESREDADGGPRRMRLDFRAKGEEHSFAVALASCLAKYTREWVMQGFNDYFRGLDPELRPTAGYRTDGERWMRDARRALALADLERDLLVRSR